MAATDDQRAAATIAASLSSLVMTASLAVIAAWVAILTFELDKREHLFWFWVISIAGLAATLASMICGGKGVAKVYKEGSGGTWDLNARKRSFDLQGILVLVGVFLVGLSITRGTSKPEKPMPAPTDPAVQKTLDDLRNQVSDLKAEYANLEGRLQSRQPAASKRSRKRRRR